MDPYVAGVLVGIGSAAVVIAVMAAVRKKQGQPKAEYDERQLAARGIAYRWAYMTLIFSLLANTGVETIWGPWAKPGVAVWMMIFLSIGVFIVACVRRTRISPWPRIPEPICGCSAQWWCCKFPTSSSLCAAAALWRTAC